MQFLLALVLKLFIETQWRPRHLDGHRPQEPDKSSAQSDYAAAWNKLLVSLARAEESPQLSLVSPKVFFSISKSKVKVCFIVNSATCTVHTYRELKLRYFLYSLVHTDNTKD